jgi:hypothetical protein
VSIWGNVLANRRFAPPSRGSRLVSGCCGIVTIVSLVLVAAVVQLILADPQTVADTVNRADASLVHTLTIVLVAIAKNLLTYASAVL